MSGAGAQLFAMQLPPFGQVESAVQVAMQYCPQSKQPLHPGPFSTSIRSHTIVTPTEPAGASGHGVSPSFCDQQICEQNPAAQ